MVKKKYFHSYIESLNIDKNILRYTTPENIAEYRAIRLKCDTIIDACCGIGGQSIYFSKYCNHVYAIDMNLKKIKIAKKICKSLNIKNITFICSNSLDPNLISIIKKADIVFIDPERPSTEDKRCFESLSPQVDEIIRLYSKLTSNFAIELPPQINQNLICYNCEKEYISLNGKINRLTIYLGKLKKYNKTAITFPSKNVIHSDSSHKSNLPLYIVVKSLNKYVYDIDNVILVSNITNEFLNMLNSNVSVFQISEKKILLTSKNLIINPFFRYRYIFLKKISIVSIDSFINNNTLLLELNLYLDKIKTKKVFLRGVIDSYTYWIIRNKLKNNFCLTNEKIIHLFILKKELIILEVI